MRFGNGGERGEKRDRSELAEIPRSRHTGQIAPFVEEEPQTRVSVRLFDKLPYAWGVFLKSSS